MSTVTKASADVNVDPVLGETATTFTFDGPIYLEPGSEYAIVVISNSEEYRTWIGQIGEIDVATSSRISKNPYGGVFFKSANGSTWTAEQNTDLKFVLNRASFTSTSQTYTLEPRFQSGESISGSIFDLIQQGIKVPGTDISYEITMGNLSGGLDYPLELGESLVLTSEKVISGAGTGANQAEVTLTLTGTEKVSPMVDQDRLSLIAIRNKINDDNTDETLAEHGLAESRYITREISLNDPADRADIFFKANLPSDVTNIEVYYRIKSGDDADISDNAWVPADIIEGPKVNADGTFEDVHYQFDPAALFNSFQIKIVFLSSNPAYVPTVKELRAIATV
jgi:hypothetical protein